MSTKKTTKKKTGTKITAKKKKKSVSINAARVDSFETKTKKPIIEEHYFVKETPVGKNYLIQIERIVIYMVIGDKLSFNFPSSCKIEVLEFFRKKEASSYTNTILDAKPTIEEGTNKYSLTTVHHIRETLQKYGAMITHKKLFGSKKSKAMLNRLKELLQ